jgi:hypothetical protein
MIISWEVWTRCYIRVEWMLFVLPVALVVFKLLSFRQLSSTRQGERKCESAKEKRTLLQLRPSCLVQLTYMKQASIAGLFKLSIEELVLAVLYRELICLFVCFLPDNTKQAHVHWGVYCRQYALLSLYIGPTSRTNFILIILAPL